jgi:asparagine synthase (glutamine-hydrolysing)
MCGIAGIYRFGATSPGARERAEDRARVAAMLRTIEYRGPDDAGLEQPGRVTFGARRLSILDVVGGHQPLSDASGRVWATQNGELYDFPRLRSELAGRHRFRTHTDTELLPALWLEHGAAAVEGLRGMFALAIHDTADGTLMLARDPLGVKPLYWARLGDRLLFASEMKALLTDPALPRDLDPEGMRRFLALGFVPGERTAFTAICKLRPGCRMLVTPSGMKIERYWAWPDFAADPAHAGASLDSLADQVGARLAESTRAMLLSDRPVGVLLSGGVDSSLLVALLPEEIRRETRTFSIGFEGGGLHDERPHARRVAEAMGTKHQESVAAFDLERELPRVVALLDEPCADPAALPAHLVARAAAEHVTVVLSGTGGDELFGGYRRHRLPGLLSNLAWLPPGLARAGARWLGERDRHRNSVQGERLLLAGKLLEARGRESFVGAYLSTLEPATPSRWRESLALAVDPAGVTETLVAEMAQELGARPAAPSAIATAVDHLWYLPDDLLLKEDRTTMGASIEGRVPYLDDALVRFAATLPASARNGDGSGKRVLRRLAERLLPADIAARPKHGFSVPIEDWLRGPLKGLAGDTFAGPGSGLFRMDVLRRWHDEHQRHVDRAGALWAALTFELWWREIGSADAAQLTAHGRPERGDVTPLPDAAVTGMAS